MEIHLRTLAAVTSLVAVLLMTGCVTSKQSPYSEKADQERALKLTTQLARTYIGEGEWEAAKRHLRYAIDAEPRNAEAHEGLALVFQNTGELELAETHYKKALRYVKPEEASRVRNNYAAYLFSLERYEEAADEFEVVIEDVLYEGRFNAFVNLGRCYEKLNDPQQAAATYRRAYLMDRKSAQVLLGLARTHFQLGDFAESQKFYDQFRRRVDTQSAASLWLGIRLADKFDDEDSRASFALALKNLYPKSREYLQYRAYMDGREPGSR